MMCGKIDKEKGGNDMPVIKLAIEVTEIGLDTVEEYLGGQEALLDELEEAAKTRLHELWKAAKEETSV